MDVYVYLHESDFNTDQPNNPNFFSEAVFCSNMTNWVAEIQKELNFTQDNDVCDLVIFQIISSQSIVMGIQARKGF